MLTETVTRHVGKSALEIDFLQLVEDGYIGALE